MKTTTTRTEEFFLRIFKTTVLIVMGLALMGMVGLLLFAAYQFSLTPKEPIPAQPAPVKEINLEDLKKYLIEREKLEGQKNEPMRQPGQERATSLRYLEDATALFRCAEGFAKAVGVEVDSRTDTEKSQELERLRATIERTADAANIRGEPWIKNLQTFMCKALEDSQLIELKKEKKIRSVFYPVLEFHVRAWDVIQNDRLNFERKEANRVTSERASEAARIAAARGLAYTCLLVAAGLFGGFMLLALYLIAAKIETNLRDINDSIRKGKST